MKYPKRNIFGRFIHMYKCTNMKKGGMYYYSKRKSRSSYEYLYKSISRWKTYIFYGMELNKNYGKYDIINNRKFEE